MKILAAITVTLFALTGLAQAETPCCGPITPAGLALVRALDAMDVEHHWLRAQSVHIDWRTGDPDGDAYEKYDMAHTHCSAFAAAVADRVRVYLLRPPEHGQTELANAQARWLASAAGAKDGWRKVSMHEAQEEANRGNLVVAIYESPYANKAGHAAIVRPSERSEELLEKDGPETTMAGEINRNRASVRWGFRFHRGAFPDGIRYYVHPLAL